MFEELIKQIKNNEIDVVDLSRQTLKKSFYITDIEKVLNALEKNTSVKKLNLEKMYLSDTDILYHTGVYFSPFRTSPLVSLVRKNKALLELNINSTGVTEVGLKKLKNSASQDLVILHSYHKTPTVEESMSGIIDVITKAKNKAAALETELTTKNELLKQQDLKIENLTKKLAFYAAKEPFSPRNLGLFAQQEIKPVPSSENNLSLSPRA